MSDSNFQYDSMSKLAQFCIRNNLRWVIYFIWFMVLPVYLLNYCKNAADDAVYDLKLLKQAKHTSFGSKE